MSFASRSESHFFMSIQETVTVLSLPKVKKVVTMKWVSSTHTSHSKASFAVKHLAFQKFTYTYRIAFSLSPHYLKSLQLLASKWAKAQILREIYIFSLKMQKNKRSFKYFDLFLLGRTVPSFVLVVSPYTLTVIVMLVAKHIGQSSCLLLARTAWKINTLKSATSSKSSVKKSILKSTLFQQL